MSANPRNLKPGELIRILNSTALGTVATERSIGQLRLEAGMHVVGEGDAKRTDLVRLVAWLATTRDRRANDTMSNKVHRHAAGSYEAHKESMRLRSLQMSRSARDIGDIPPVVNPAVKEECRLNLKRFLEVYFSETFNLAWSPDHITVIRAIEAAVLEGQLKAIAMPRGSGKSAICKFACLWAALYGHHQYIVLLAATEQHADRLLEDIKTAIVNNPYLSADFPEVCYPVQKLEGINQRAKGQLYKGSPTRISWVGRQLLFPTIEDSPASGVLFRVSGITGAIRGMAHLRPDGRTVRPSLVLLDDPQTDETASSKAQTEKRMRIVGSAVLGLAGPGKKIAGLMTMTVIYTGDLADQILDRRQHPAWQAERIKMVKTFPKNEALWLKYSELLAEGMMMGKQRELANEFYLANRAKMDEGAQVYWEARFEEDEFSAIQHAMNKLYKDEQMFWSECQQEPRAKEDGPKIILQSEPIMQRLNKYRRGVVPPNVATLTMFVDVQDKLLYYMVVGWEPNFSGHVVDYGTWPDQERAYFVSREVRKSLQDALPTESLEAQIMLGLHRLAEQTMALEWRRPDGTAMRISRCMIDANYHRSTDVVYEFCRVSPFAAQLIPSRAVGIGAAGKPMNDYRREPGERVGNNWRIPKAQGTKMIRHIRWDTNAWKSFVAQRLLVPEGGPGGIWLFGSKAMEHRLLADHLSSEYPVRTEGRGRTVDEWKLRPNKPDNHWFDCLVGAAVAASEQGVKGIGHETQAKRKTVSLSERWKGIPR